MFLFGYIGSLSYVHISTLRVPNVVGKTIHEASLLLAKNNIAFKVLSEKEDSFLQEGTVISQIPSEGQDIKFSRPLLVVLAKKPKPVLMSDLFAKNTSEILDLGNDLQRKINVVSIARPYADGKCFAQSPGKNSELIDDKIIAYVAIKTPRLYITPSFIGLPVVMVKELLKDQHVLYDLVDEGQGATDESERCIVDQMPIPGTIVQLERVRMQFSSGNR